MRVSAKRTNRCYALEQLELSAPPHPPPPLLPSSCCAICAVRERVRLVALRTHLLDCILAEASENL